MKVGFIINPIAGMGGSVALKGTDGAEALASALALGAVPKSALRAALAVRVFAPHAPGHQFYAPSGSMGMDVLSEAGIRCECVWETSVEPAPQDTVSAARAMADAGAELLIFAGGDGTARDVCSVLGTAIPAVGIPAGVKIHSPVYAKSPKAAGMVVAKCLDGQVRSYSEVEIVDIDEDAFRQGVVNSRLYGYMTAPVNEQFMQDRKSGNAASDAYSTSAIATAVADSMELGRTYLIGSGSTTYAITERMGLSGTLLGVDAVCDGCLVGRDLTERQILELITPGTRLVVTVIGGQGHIFGRGNQQLSPEVLRLIGKDNITVIATPSKMSALFGKPLLVDTGDSELNRHLCGYMSVITGYDRRMMMRVAEF